VSQIANAEDIAGSTTELGRSSSKSSKRSKGEPAAIKYMSADYMKADVRDLGAVIADMLMELVRINDPLPFKNEQLTRFHSRLVLHSLIVLEPLLIIQLGLLRGFLYTTISIDSLSMPHCILLYC